MTDHFGPGFRIRIALAFATTALALSGCAVDGQSTQGPNPARRIYIPESHMPPPGTCRIWIPHLPPDRQSPPGNCHQLERRVPMNAVLVRG